MSVTIPAASKRVAALNMALLERIPTLGFVAQQVLTPMPVQDKAGLIRQAKVAQFNVLETATRAANSGFGRVNMALTSVSFECVEYGLEAIVDRANARQYASEFDFLVAQGEQVARSVLLNLENRVKTAVFNTTTFPLSGNTGLDASASWATASTDVISDVQAAKAGILARCGMRPDSMLISEGTWNNLWKNTGIRASFSYTLPAGLPSPADAAMVRLLGSTLGIPNLIVANAVYSTNHETASPTVSSLWGETYAFVFAKAPSDPMAAGLGRMPYWATEADDGAGLGVMEYYPSEDKRGNVVRFVQHVDELVTMSEAGFLIKID